jgi:hypothetical protein
MEIRTNLIVIVLIVLITSDVVDDSVSQVDILSCLYGQHGKGWLLGSSLDGGLRGRNEEWASIIIDNQSR